MIVGVSGSWGKCVATLGLVLVLPSPAVPLANATTNVYDERSRLRSSSDTFGRSITQDFDELDRVETIRRTDSKGSSDEEVITRTYYCQRESQSI